MNTTTTVRALFAGAISLLFVPAVFGVNRMVDFNVPSHAGAGTTIKVEVYASTNATDAERVGFLHWDYSTNGGGSWNPINYDYNLGKSVSRTANITAGSAGSTIKLRARVAFRDGGAGDVDYNGGAINWGGSWGSWGSPPTKEVSIPVVPVTNFTGLTGAGQGANNAAILNNLISGFANNGDQRVLQFPAGTYEFLIPGNPAGQMNWLTNVRNLIVRGHHTGTVLKWRIANDDPAHSFFLVNQDCRNIRFENLTFTTWLEDVPGSTTPGGGQGGSSWGGRQTDGTHIKIFGKHVTVTNCTFKYAPGFAIAVADWNNDAADDNISITTNSFLNNMGDPIHVHTGQNIWIVGNYINSCGDDAIAVVADDYNGTTNLQKADGVYIWWNTILNGGWRGIAVVTADNVDMRKNTITNTGGHGIEITSILYEKNLPPTPGSWPTGFLLHDGTHDSAIDENGQNVSNTITGYGGIMAKDGVTYGNVSRDKILINTGGVVEHIK